MLPGVYEFRFDAAHVIFLGAFWMVVTIIAATVAAALAVTIRDLRRGKAGAIAWHQEFESLPDGSRLCRHAMTGEAPGRICPNGFDCRGCEGHGIYEAVRREMAAASLAAEEMDAAAGLIARRTPQAAPEEARSSAPGVDATGMPPGGESIVRGFTLRRDRLYHRGHTWARPERDGAMTVGLDDIASRLIGEPDRVDLPAQGSRVRVNEAAWRLRKGTAEVRILSPVDGEVIALGGPSSGWYLKVRPAASQRGGTDHLLSADEAEIWTRREADRLQSALSGRQLGATMADGGLPVDRLSETVPDPERDAILGEILLDP